MNRIALMPLALGIAVTLACNTGTRNDTAEIREDADATVTDTGAVGTAGDENNREWVATSMDANMAEVELGRMAQTQAASPEVKQFAQMMVTDHSKALDELKPIASRQGTPAVAQMSEENRELRDRLSKLRGEEFDREYMQAMIDSHEKVINHLQARANEDRLGDNKGQVTPEQADDPLGMQINQWAANALPTTRHHLEEARRINDGLDDRQTRR
jgi:putative membrane protein